MKRADLDRRTCHRRDNKDAICSQCLIRKARCLKVGVQGVEKFVSPNHFPAPPPPRYICPAASRYTRVVISPSLRISC